MVKPVVVHVRFPQQLPAAKDEEQVIQACLRGLAHAADKLGGASRADLSIYVYPDPRSIASLTGQCGDGHAIVEARVPHVVRYDPAEGGGFEKLLAHEGTHALAYETWGAAGTPLLGEGLAVWASGSYGGVSLNRQLTCGKVRRVQATGQEQCRRREDRWKVHGSPWWIVVTRPLEILRIRGRCGSSTNQSPFGATAIPVGSSNVASSRGPSLPPFLSDPARVVTMPSGEILRMRPLCSTIIGPTVKNTRPFSSTAMPEPG